MSEGRRTRSAKTKSEVDVQELPMNTRNTRRGRKQNMEEEERETNIEVESELLETVENSCADDIGSLDFECPEPEVNQETVDDTQSSSNHGFYENITFENPVDENSETKETIEPVNQDMFIADFAEENANSVPSTLDENLAMIVEDDDIQHDNNAQTTLSNDFEMNDDELSSETKTEDTLAQSEDLKQKDEQATDLDAENISEDELPIPTKPKVQGAENISDDELPGPKMADLPADTEIVSEEELPSSNTPNSVKNKDGKRKLEDYDPCDPTADENELPEKKTKKEDEDKKYKLPDLEKYWKSVNADPEDFNAWTYLLQYVDSENDVEAAREAYNKFLARYSYCYGYWRKLVDYEKKRGNIEKCEEVFERGLKAIPLSVDLWIHYLTYMKQKYQDDCNAIRSQFERALNSCGLEFRSDKLWEGYIRWELEGKNLLKVMDIYDRLLATPTQGYKTHMDNFRELVNNNPVQKLLTVEEFIKLREDVRKGSIEKGDDETPPGLDEADDHVRNEEEADSIRKLIINKRKKINKSNVEMINKRWSFEEGIKRPYFHVKQLEKIQLKNWKEYLDFEIEQKDKRRILVLFERCLIACALYEEFWIKLINYLEQNKDDSEYQERMRDVFERACCIHHREKPSLHLMWSAFEESCGNIDKSSTILENLDKKNPNMLQIAYRRINLERRRGNLELCTQLYEKYLSNAKNKNLSSSLAIKYARFLNKVKHEYDRAMDVLKSALEKDTTNTRLALQIIDLALQRDNINEKEVLEVLDSFMQQENLDIDQKLLFAQRKVEFLEDFGSCVQQLQEAQKTLQNLMEKHSKDNKKKSSDHELTKKSKESSSSVNNPAYNSSVNYQNYSNSSYPQSNQWSGNYNYDYNQWSGSYYNSSSYGNYQHGSYGNSY